MAPDGRLLTGPGRGLFWGNRGALLDRDGRVTRPFRGRAWIICVLEFKGRHRTQWAPGRLTELYFLDEATALAAGHRPCGECRRTEYRAFQQAWHRAFPGEPVGAPDLDARLHADRFVGPATHRTHRAPAGELADGVMIDLDGAPWLVRADELLAWTVAGYADRRARSRLGDGEVNVLTPRSTGAVLAAGYQPTLHPSAHRS